MGGAGMWACQPLLEAEACPLCEGDQQARCTNGAAGGWFEQAGLPAAPNTRSERPRHVRQALFRTSFCRIGFGGGIPTKGRKRKRRRSGAKLGGGALPTNVRAQPMRVNQGAGHRNSAASHDRTSSRAVGSASAHAPRRGTRPNSRPWGINAILARTARRLSSSIASRTALAAGWLSNAVAARTASRAA